MAERRREWSSPSSFDSWKFVQDRAVRGVLLTGRGSWSNADVYGAVPDAWCAVGALEITVWALLGSAKVPVVTVGLDVVPRLSVGGITSWRGVQVRGCPCDGFEVTVRNLVGGTFEAGFTYLECWGTESTPEASGELLHDAMRNTAPPIRAARASYYDAVSDVWRRGRGDQRGNPYVMPVARPYDDAEGSGVWGRSGFGLGGVVAVAEPVRLHQLAMVNGSAAVRYLQVFDDVVVPPDGSVPYCAWPIRSAVTASAPECEVPFPEGGLELGVGAVLVCSSTLATKTEAADAHFGWFGRLIL